MKILLDTNICIYLLKNMPRGIRKRMNDYAAGEIGISACSVAELWYGAEKSKYGQKSHFILEEFFTTIEVIPFEEQAARQHGVIRAYLEKLGKPIGLIDSMIAAQALLYRVPLVTNNLNEFMRVPGLVCENWV